MDDQDRLRGMMVTRSPRTGKHDLLRKLTINEGLPDEKRVYQNYHDVHMQSTPDAILRDALVIEALSPEPGEPLTFRLQSLGSEGFCAEGSAQVAETILRMLEAASYAEGKDIRAYADEILSR